MRWVSAATQLIEVDFLFFFVRFSQIICTHSSLASCRNDKQWNWALSVICDPFMCDITAFWIMHQLTFVRTHRQYRFQLSYSSFIREGLLCHTHTCIHWWTGGFKRNFNCLSLTYSFNWCYWTQSRLARIKRGTKWVIRSQFIAGERENHWIYIYTMHTQAHTPFEKQILICLIWVVHTKLLQPISKL